MTFVIYIVFVGVADTQPESRRVVLHECVPSGFFAAMLFISDCWLLLLIVLSFISAFSYQSERMVQMLLSHGGDTHNTNVFP